MLERDQWHSHNANYKKLRQAEDLLVKEGKQEQSKYCPALAWISIIFLSMIIIISMAQALHLSL
jgi:hypothetical protein